MNGVDREVVVSLADKYGRRDIEILYALVGEYPGEMPLVLRVPSPAGERVFRAGMKVDRGLIGRLHALRIKARTRAADAGAR